jgi:hypothetical protein
VELAETLPSIPLGRRVVRKRKAHVVESSKYEFAALLNCQISVLLHANIVHLESTCFSSRARTRRGGYVSISFCNGNSYHCHGRHRATSWCDPAASNKYRGGDAPGSESEESCHEEVFNVSIRLFFAQRTSCSSRLV